MRFLRGFLRLTPNAGKAGLFNGFKTIVQNVAKDAWRKLARSWEVPMTDLRWLPASPGSEPKMVAVAVSNAPRAGAVARDREMQQALRVVLASLDSEYQQVRIRREFRPQSPPGVERGFG